MNTLKCFQNIFTYDSSWYLFIVIVFIQYARINNIIKILLGWGHFQTCCWREDFDKVFLLVREFNISLRKILLLARFLVCLCILEETGSARQWAQLFICLTSVHWKQFGTSLEVFLWDVKKSEENYKIIHYTSHGIFSTSVHLQAHTVCSSSSSICPIIECTAIAVSAGP